MDEPRMGRPKGVGKWDSPQPPSRKINRSGSTIGAWCYRCKSEHRWEDKCQ